jgi:small multidrug resistance pump
LIAYLLLLGAIGVEVVGTSTLKSTEGFTRLWPTVITLVAYAASFALMSQVVRHIPVYVAYAVWSALGTAAIVAIGVTFLGESINAVQIAGIVLVIGGVVAINLGGAH